MATMILQLFNDEVIPAELEGVSPEIAREILAEAKSQPPAPEVTEQKPEQVEQEPDTEATSADADSDNKQYPADDAGKEQHIPYQRFKQVNDRAKASEAEVARLKAEMEALRAQAQTQTQPSTPVDVPNAPQQAIAAPNTNVMPKELVRQVRETAFASTLESPGMSVDEYKELEYSDDPMARIDFQTAYNLELNRIMLQANQVVAQQKQEQVKAQTLQQQINQDYDKFAETMKSSPEFDQVWEYVTSTKFNELGEYEKVALNAAYERAQSGKGSAQDVALVKNYFSAASAEYKGKSGRNKSEAVIRVPDKVNQTEAKLSKLQAHPRVEQVNGSAGGTDLTMADIERMLQTTDWDDVDPAIQKMLLQG